MSNASNIGLRGLAQALAPPWLSDSPDAPLDSDDTGSRLMYLLGALPDALVDKCQQGMYARLPLQGTSSPSGGRGAIPQDAISLIGADRVMVQGIGEPTVAFAGRLQRAFPTWQHAGQATTVMQEVLAYLQSACRAAVIRAPVVSGSIKAFAVEYPASANTRLPAARWNPTAWDWDTGYGIGGAPNAPNGWDPHPLTLADAWWRSWLVLWSVAPNDWTDAAPAWGSGRTWGDPTFSWGLSVPSSTVASIRALLPTWKCANTWYRWIVVSLDANFGNWSSGFAYYPTSGKWEHWADPGGTATNADGTSVPAYVPARAANLRYCDGVS